ncbi:MAG: hypothetical protein LUD27_07490 [Clostridia bacterium]|nr:hypothetical protein [Clostridia bacterium]
MDANLDNNPYCFEYIEASISDTSKPKEGTKLIGEVQEIQLYDIEHFNGKLIHEMRNVFLVLGIICFLLAAVACVALQGVGFEYLNLIVAGVLGILTIVFLILYAVKRKSYFKMEIYFGKYRNDILDVNYNDTVVNLGNKFPAKVEVYTKLSKKEDLADKQSKFVSKLGSLMASNGAAAYPAVSYNSVTTYGMAYGAGYGYASMTPVYCIKIDPEEKTISLASLY